MLVFIFLILFLIPSIKKHENTSTNINKKNCFIIFTEKVFYIIFDHEITRTFSIIFIDIIINFLCYSESLFFMSCATLFFIFVVLFHFFYFSTFRLCQKFDSSSKYIYDPYFTLYYDNFFFII